MNDDDSTPRDPAAGPIAGLKVLDLSRVLAGPFCGQSLADLGADVLKVEKPGDGDDTRHWGPPFVPEPADARADAAYYLAANRGKRSIEIDLSRPEGQAIVRRLAARADIVLENYKVGQLARYGLDYASLSALNPRLIYCSVTGFGQTGPWSHRAGYDFIIQGLGGFMSITGEADDRPGGGPQKAGVAIADLMTGLYATQAVLAAVIARERTGRGQWIDMALLDCQVAMLANAASNYLVSRERPRRWGNAHPNVVPYETFKTRDDWIILAVGNDGQFGRFCDLAGCAELARDPRFVSASARTVNREALIPLLRTVIAHQPAAHWIAELERAGVPCGSINAIDQVFENPQVRARGMQIALRRSNGVEVPLVRNPIVFSDTPTVAERAPPLLGEHTDDVLSELGHDADAIAALRAAGIVGPARR